MMQVLLMISCFTATQFHRFMGTGRTAPALCGCEDELGNHAGDFVVKLRGGLDRGVDGLMCELVASRLAAYFGLTTPDPALIIITADFAAVVLSLEACTANPKKAKAMQESVGLNFGSRQLTGVVTWPVDKAIPATMLQSATDVFVFDGLIQNPDRRFNNPNLFARSDEIIVFDHELAFSFLLDLFPSSTPWRVDDHRSFSDHVFYTKLKSKPIDLDRFASRLHRLGGSPLDSIVADVPPEWNNRSLTRILQHLKDLSDHSGEFIDAIRGGLV